jgi:ADP-ribosyl-[dinitrogen reductase] hydrolase
MAMQTSPPEKYCGCLLGLAIGDAMGAPAEFNEPGSFEPVGDLNGGGYFRLQPGEWTDDTALTLCSSESLIERKGFDPHDHLARFLKWYREGYMSTRPQSFGIGLVTAAALLRFESTHEDFCGPTGEKTAENGSLMRIAPIPLFYADQPEKAIQIAAGASRITHGTPDAISACQQMGALIVKCVQGCPKEEILKPYVDIYAPPNINRSNYSDAVITFRAALWAFAATDNFKDGLLKVVNLGWDADTMGAAYGQLAGAYYGENGIPKEWRNKVLMSKKIIAYADALFKKAFTSPPAR